MRLDEWANVLTGLAQGERDASRFTAIALRPPMQQAELDAAYTEDSIFARIVDAIPEHATRRWIGVTSDGDGAPDDFGKIALDALEDLRAQERFSELMRLDRKDGGALMLIGADDGLPLEQPLNMAGIRTLTHLHVIERWYVQPGMLGSPAERDTDVLSPTFGESLYYTILGGALTASKQTKVHRSRVIPLHGIRVSEVQLHLYNGWGQSVIHRAWTPVQRFRELLGYIGAAIKNISQPVFKIAGLRALMAEEDEGGGSTAADANLRKLMTDLQMMRSTLKAVVLDSEDSFEEVGLSLAGLADVLKMVVDDLAAAAEQPLSVLFGHSPQGFSTDDEPGKRNFYDSIALKQRRLLLHPLNRLLDIMRACSDGPLAGLPKDFRHQIQFLPLEEPDERVAAEAFSLRLLAEVAGVNAGIFDPLEIRSKYHDDPNSPYDLEDFAPVKPEPVLDPALAQPEPPK